MPGCNFGVVSLALAAAVICTATGSAALAQDMPPMAALAVPAPDTAPPPASAAPAATNPTPAPAAPEAKQLSQAQLDQLVAPIALYPDPLLSQILMASTYPLEIVEAERWVVCPPIKS